MKPKHIPGVEDTLADSLSRLDRAGDCELNQENYQRGLRTLGLIPTVDCFANKMNTKCKRFFAPALNRLAKGAAAIDAMTQNWGREHLLYVHPPIDLIPVVLQKIEQERCNAIMIVPSWPGHS
jgi:hypothetical protein